MALPPPEPPPDTQPDTASVTRIHNVYQVTTDMDRAVAFYRDALGLEVKFRDGDNWCQLAAGDTRLALASPAEAAPAVAGSVVVFRVGDLDAACAALAAAGTEILTRRDMGAHGRVATLRDPDGTVLQLFEPAAG